MVKLCPFMSYPAVGPEETGLAMLVRVPCEGPDCMAWEPERTVDHGIEKGPDGEPVFLKRTYPGYCRLIVRCP